MPIYVRTHRFANQERLDASIQYNIVSFSLTGHFGMISRRMPQEEREQILEPIESPLEWLEALFQGFLIAPSCYLPKDL